MKVTICGPNLNDQSKGQFHIHAADCAHLVRLASREPEYRYGWTIVAETRDEVGDEIYADMIEEGSMEPGEGASDCHFFPCCDALLTTDERDHEETLPGGDALEDISYKTEGLE